MTRLDFRRSLARLPYETKVAISFRMLDAARKMRAARECGRRDERKGARKRPGKRPVQGART